QGISSSFDDQGKFSSVLDAAKAGLISIGRGGFYRPVETPPEVNTWVKFSFQFEKEGLLEGWAIVRWARAKTVDSNHFGYGAEIFSLKKDTQIWFKSFLEVVRPIAFIPGKKAS